MNLASSKKLVSKYGKLLLHELSSKDAQFDLCLNYIENDCNAGRMKNKETGNNSYHLLLGSNFSADFIIPLLKALILRTPLGLREKNITGSLPIHYLLSQPEIIIDAALLVINSYPESASIPETSQGLLPIFLSIMRDNASIEIVEALCNAYPEGPSSFNQSNSLPLHYASKREFPNKEILKLLLYHNPNSAKIVNKFGFLPLHCISQICSNDLEAVEIIYDAYPEAIKICDLQGKLPLHLATLAVGKDHMIGISREQEEVRIQIIVEPNNKNNNVYSDDDYDEDIDDEVNKVNEMKEISEGRSRNVIKFLISKWPQSLCCVNKFNSTPVETVLEKTKIVKSKIKTVSIFGLYDDPPTARLLLCSQKYFHSQGILPALRTRYLTALKELNWLVRKYAIFASIIGTNMLKTTDIDSFESLSINNNNNNKKKYINKRNNNQKSNKSSNKKIDILNNNKVSNNNSNILSRLRQHGEEDCFRMVISFL